MPVGRCFRATQVETLFTFCPPGPEDLINFSSISRTNMPDRLMRRSRSPFFSEDTNKEVLVSHDFIYLAARGVNYDDLIGAIIGSG